MKRNDCIEVLDHLKEKLKEKDIIAIQDSVDNYKCPVCGQRVDFTLPRNRIN